FGNAFADVGQVSQIDKFIGTAGADAQIAQLLYAAEFAGRVNADIVVANADMAGILYRILGLQQLYQPAERNAEVGHALAGNINKYLFFLGAGNFYLGHTV